MMRCSMHPREEVHLRCTFVIKSNAFVLLSFIIHTSDSRKDQQQVNRPLSANGKMARRCMVCHSGQHFNEIGGTVILASAKKKSGDFRLNLSWWLCALTPSSMSNYICWIASFYCLANHRRRGHLQTEVERDRKRRTRYFPSSLFRSSLFRSFVLSRTISCGPIMGVNHPLGTPKREGERERCSKTKKRKYMINIRTFGD